MVLQGLESGRCRSGGGARRTRRRPLQWKNAPIMILLSHLLLLSSTAMLLQPRRSYTAFGLWRHPAYVDAGSAPTNNQLSAPATRSRASTSDDASSSSSTTGSDKNSRYIEGLLYNLAAMLDKWIISGSKATQKRIYNVLEQIQAASQDDEFVKRANRMIRRAGLPIPDAESEKELGKTDEHKRRQEADQRKRWEEARTVEVGRETADAVRGRSALSRREKSEKKDILLGNVDPSLSRVQSAANDKAALEKEMKESENEEKVIPKDESLSDVAAAKVSELIAKAGAGTAFDGDSLGIGGLDDVLAQVKRRVWTPLAAPPKLLEELGIHPVRGLLLYGRPGCGKTLLARKLGQLLSPLRPITVVSGPEVMDKFVGSSEKNVREIFDNPPDIYDFYRIGQRDAGDSIARAALHLVVMDEFDAIGRSRGGRGGTGDQGDAGVARDSVVNQILAKLDGVDPLIVPTMVIALTNRRSLIEPALLRPGRFEVQIEVPPPRTLDQRISILKVHTKHMHQTGRLLVRDAPEGTAASRHGSLNDELMTYYEFLEKLANECEGFSGATMAGVCRAAASHSLERAVEEFTLDTEGSSLLEDCVVTEEDFACALTDVLDSQGDSDWSEDEDAR